MSDVKQSHTKHKIDKRNVSASETKDKIGKQNVSFGDTKEEKDTSDNPCTINRSLLIAKVVYLLEYAKEGCHWQYLMLFLVSVGLDTAQAGTINGLRYIGSVITAPLFGYIADKRKNHKRLVILICILSILVNSLYLVASFFLKIAPKQEIIAHPVHTTVHHVAVGSEFELVNPPNPKLFFTILVIALVGSALDGSTLTFADYGVFQRIKAVSPNSDFGMQRCMGPAGYSLGSSISSVVITFSHFSDISPYSGIFVVYCCLTGALTICYHFVYVSDKTQTKDSDTQQQQTEPAEEDSSEHKNEKGILDAFRQFKTWFFFITIAINGELLAFGFSFTFLYLKELGASSLLFGLSDVVNGSMSFVFFLFSKNITNIVNGTVNAMCLSCLFWFIRFFPIAFISNPFWVIAMNVTNGICCSLFVYAYMEFVSENFTTSILTTMYGITNAIYYSFGYLSANLIGGYLYKGYGLKELFCIHAFVSLIWSLAIITYACVERIRRKRKLQTKTKK